MDKSQPSTDRDSKDVEFDPDEAASSGEAYKNALVVHNMAVIADTGVDLDLGESLNKFGNSTYDPKEFNCIRLDVRIRKEYDSFCRMPKSVGFEHIHDVPVVEATKVFATPKILNTFHNYGMERCPVHKTLDSNSFVYTSVKVSVFQNGKLAVTGARSLLSATAALEKVCRAFRKRINRKARLRHITTTNILVVYAYPHKVILPLFHKACKGSSYDPFRFSGVRVRVPINAPQVFYTPFEVLHMLNFSTKYSHLVPHTKDAESGSDDCESDDSEEAVQVPNAFVPPPTKKFKSAKLGIQRFVDSTITDKRQVHHLGSQVVVKKRKTKLPKNVSIWTNTNLLGKDTPDPTDPLGKGDPTLKTPKEEAVTVNVFSSGNVTFTGARTISSIQQALSYIYPFLQAAARKT